MIWNMTFGTWLYYFALPWSTFIFTVVYGFYWLLSPKYKKDSADDGADALSGEGEAK